MTKYLVWAMLLLPAWTHATFSSWRLDAHRALREARRAEAPALLNIGAGWCAQCAELEATTLAQPEVIEALRGLTTIKVDSDQDPEFARTYRAEVLPTLILIGSDGEILARSQGVISPTELLGMLDDAGAACDLTGQVLSAAGRPLEASLWVLPHKVEAATDDEGFYCLRDLQPGPIELIVQADGRMTRSSLSIEAHGRRARHDVRLAAGRSEMVVVTGTRTAKLLRDAPVRTEIVSRERIDQSAARTLADAVEYTPGIRVESNCQNCNFSQVRMLGLEGAYNQILIDGTPQWSSLSQVYGIEQIPTRLIDRLEVVKGGGSSIYGPGAVGGVINVIPRRPTTTGGVIETRGEGWSEGGGYSINGAYDWVASDQRTFVSIYGQEDLIPGQDLSGDGFTEISERALSTVGLRAQHSLLDGRGRLTADFSMTDSLRRGGNRIDLPPERTELAEEISTQRRSVALRWNQQVSDTLAYHVSGVYVGTERDTYYGGGMDPDAFGFSDNPLWLGEAQFNHSMQQRTVSWGVQFQSDAIRDEQPAIGRALDETYTNLGLFVQDDVNLSPTHSLVYGLRVDQHSEVAQAIVSPRAAFKWSPQDELALRTSVSTGFRPPAVFDEDLHIELAGGSQRQVVLADDLNEERSISLMQGVEWLPRVNDRFWLIEGNLFYTALDDVFENEEIATNLFEKRNLGGAAVYGVEMGFGVDLPSRVTVELGWVHQRARFDDPEADFGARDFLRTPKNTGVLNLTLRDERWGQAFVGLRYTGPMDVPRFFFDATGEQTAQALTRSDAFLSVDASLARSFSVGESGSKVRLQLGVRNLTDEFQQDIDQGPFRDSDFVFGPRFPRSVYLSTAWTF